MELKDWLEIAQAILAILGSLKVVARYTKTDWDDKIIEKCEAPLKWILALLPGKKK